MTRTISFLTLGLLLFVAGCHTPPAKTNEWGETYQDVVVPENYKPHDSPPFKRVDRDGKRVFGTYSFKSSSGLDTPSKVAAWFKTQLPNHGWENQLDDIDDTKGTLKARYKKGDDQLVLKLVPDEKVNNSERFSILTVEMNPQYDN